MPEVYTVGETIILEVDFIDSETEAYADPTSIAVHIRKPSTVTTNAYPGTGWTKVAVGRYEFRVVASDPGIWIYEFEGNEVHKPRYLTVRNPVVA